MSRAVTTQQWDRSLAGVESSWGKGKRKQQVQTTLEFCSKKWGGREQRKWCQEFLFSF